MVIRLPLGKEYSSGLGSFLGQCVQECQLYLAVNFHQPGCRHEPSGRFLVDHKSVSSSWFRGQERDAFSTSGQTGTAHEKVLAVPDQGTNPGLHDPRAGLRPFFFILRIPWNSAIAGNFAGCRNSVRSEPIRPVEYSRVLFRYLPIEISNEAVRNRPAVRKRTERSSVRRRKESP